MEIFPQVLINVKVSKYGRVRFTSDMEIKNAIKRAENELGNDGRVLVRSFRYGTSCARNA